MCSEFQRALILKSVGYHYWYDGGDWQLLCCTDAAAVLDLGFALLSAAQPRDQGEESVLLLVVVSSSHVQFFLGAKRKNLVSNGVGKGKKTLS